MQSKRKFISLLTKALYLIWTFLLLSILVIIIERTYKYAEYIATKEATTSVNKDIAYRSWIASHGGVYVQVDKRTPPNPYLANIKDRDFTAIGRDYTLMNGAYILSQMMRDYSKLYGIKTKITSSKLLNPKNRADSWETIALDNIDQTHKNYIELSTLDNEEYLRLMSPLVTEKSCLKCHAFQGYKIGDIRGGVSVAIPMKPLYRDAFNSSLFIAALFMLIWLVGLFFISLLSKKIHAYIDEKEILYEEYIYGLVSMVEQRDTYTAGHSSRVAKYADLIARGMGYTEQDCHLIHRAGMLHDIGKVAIPDSVFLKPTKLSNREYKLIQEHVVLSYEMLKNISIFDDIKEIVRNHHEHYDGRGYPRGLNGEDTPMLAQILTLADAFDAMTTNRIYKGRKGINETLAEIAKLSGKQFNPKIVPIALGVLKDVTIDIHQQNPETLLEQERFSYFYRDVLTGVYNEAYLHTDIEYLANKNFIFWLSLKNFHLFNKQYGWNLGDKILQEIAEIMKKNVKESSHIYRFYGDNFLVSLDQEAEIELLKEYLETMLNKNNIYFDIKIAQLGQQKLKNIESLEDVLKNLF